MKNKEIQTFKTSEAVSVLVQFSVVVAIIIGIIYNNSSESHEDSARKSMNSLTSQLLAGGIKMAPNNAQSLDGRQPASVLDRLNFAEMGGPEGRIGRDPWGHSYHYKVVKSDKVGFVVLISGGPDGEIQTDYTQIQTGPNGHLLGAKFASDDIGTIKKIH